MEPVRDPISERWQTIADLFARASDLPPTEWEDFLESATSEPETRDEVRRLLALTDSASGFFARLSAEIGSIALPARLRDGHVVSSRFRVSRFLASGGMGEVYEAEDLELGGRVALKVMKPALANREGGLQRFRDEIRLARSVNSIHVCRVFDVARDADPIGGDLIYFTMELLDGSTLTERLKQSGPFTLDEARPFIRQMALGLDAAHRLGILHRDFKSGNVMICAADEGWRAVITDFGLARAVASPDSIAAPVDGATPAYVAPEQLERKEETPRTDLYSFGVVLYEMMTGSTPFRGANAFDVAQKRLTAPPESPRVLRPDLPAHWETAILRCLERDPSKRFGSALEVAEALGCQDTPRIGRRTWLAAAAGALAAGYGAWWEWRRWHSPVELPSIAVLPFEAGSPDVAYLADGIADRLTDSLTGMPGVRVVARTSAQRLRDASKKLGEVAKQFQVRYVISGAVKKSGKRLHVTSEIVEASTGFQLWAGTDDLDPEQTEGLCSQISRTVIHTLHVDALPAQLTAIDRHLTKSPEAYQLYLLGRYHAARRNRAALEESVKVLERALEIDPEFAAGYAALGFSYYDLSARDRRDWAPLVARSLDAAGRALKLDSNNAEAYLVIGCNQRTWGWDWNRAEESFRRALTLNPSLVEAHRMYAHLLSRSAKHAEALQQIDLALSLDPLNTGMKVSRATLLLYAGRTHEALEQYESVRSADPAYENVYIPMSDALERTGRMDAAIAACEHGVALTKRAAYALSSLGRLYGLAHRTAEANAILTELLERYKHDDSSATEVAYVYLGLGDKDRAFEWLERGVPARDSNLLLLKVGPEFEPLRSDSRYTSLLARLKL